ncbi:MAG: hypothetical protein EXR79_15940 [Myxococcales bacterium]|nr:hypothetical protein [Myxococcales bacterium]
MVGLHTLAVPHAHATQGEWHAAVAGVGGWAENRCCGMTDTSGARVGIDGRWLRDVTDFWSFGAGVRHWFSLTDARFGGRQSPWGSAALTAEARLALDALQWIPFVQAGAGWEVVRTRLGLRGRVEVGLGWRPQRTSGWEVRVGVEAGHEWRGVVAVGWVGYGGGGVGLDL